MSLSLSHSLLRLDPFHATRQILASPVADLRLTRRGLAGNRRPRLEEGAAPRRCQRDRRHPSNAAILPAPEAFGVKHTDLIHAGMAQELSPGCCHFRKIRPDHSVSTHTPTAIEQNLAEILEETARIFGRL